MTIKVHHLGVSQAERIVWLCEELGLSYELIKHVRDPLIAPESLKSVPGNATGKAPYIEDTDTGVQLAESLAISDYLIYKYGGGKLALKPDDKHFADYLYWYHYSNGTAQPAMTSSLFLSFTEGDNMGKQFANARLHASLKHVDTRLKDNKWLAGPEFTAADVMSVYGYTTQRYWVPVSLVDYPNIVRWLKDCAAREGYKRAMEKGDPDMEPMLAPEGPKVSMFEAGGTKSDHWKKKGTL